MMRRGATSPTTDHPSAPIFINSSSSTMELILHLRHDHRFV
jgi:hypothetical protein